MGGCYTAADYEAERKAERLRTWRGNLRNMLQENNRFGLTTAYKEFFQNGNTSFIGEVARVNGISDVSKIPKEFPEWEYEFKFDVGIVGKGAEPKNVSSFLKAFDFPVLRDTRFLRDPVNHVAEGVNRFYGVGDEERLVVITKCDNSYVKEKGVVMPIKLGVPFEHMVVKRTEERHQADIDEVANRISDVTGEGAKYMGRLRKEKGDDFILDADSGRLYSFTITRAHLTRVGERKEDGVQRQIEIEYAGYIPGFPSFEKGSERQLVGGLVDLAKYTFNLNRQTPLSRDLSFTLWPTSERKYDFVCGHAIADSDRKQLQLFDDASLGSGRTGRHRQGRRLLEKAIENN